MGSWKSGFTMWSDPPLSTECFIVPKCGGALPANRNVTLSAVVRKLVRFGFLPKSFLTFEELCKKADQDLFRNILNNPGHILHYLLPPVSVILLTDFILVII